MAKRGVPGTAEVKALLDEAYERHARPSFVDNDPLRLPRSFSQRGDAETIGFLVATIAWGRRDTIIANGWKLAGLMDHAPHDFVLHAGADELRRLERFVHRTFN